MKSAACFAILLFAAGLFCLAPAPQNPDGAELVMAALQGGVLHPPGYPLQAWIGKLWLQLPFGNPAWGYALLCLGLQSLAAFAFLSAARELGVGTLNRLCAALILFCFPPLFVLGIQPEKYALVLLFASLLMMKRFWFLSGVALTQHFGLVIYLPLVLWRYPHKNLSGLARYTSVCIGGFLLAQLSLLVLARFGGWPDWGALQSLDDLVRHTMRADIGFLGGTRGMGDFGSQRSSLGMLWEQWPWVVLVWGLALIPSVARLRTDRNSLVLAVCLLLGIVALWFARLPGTTALDKEYLSRYWVIVMPLTALMIGIGMENGRRWQRLFGVAALVTALVAALLHRQELTLGGSRVFDVYRSALSGTLGQNLAGDHAPIYISSSDVEPFWGVQSADGSMRFPIAGDYPWYLERKFFILDPRIASWTDGLTPASTAQVMGMGLTRGLPVVTTTPDALPVRVPWKQYGLYAQSSAPGEMASTDELAQVAAVVCASIVSFGQEAPSPVRQGTLELWESLRQPFRLLAERSPGSGESGAAASSVFMAMSVEKPGAVVSACRKFLEGERSDEQRNRH